MTECELLLRCPFYIDMTQNPDETTAHYIERYCRGNYTWCGRYMALKALEKEMSIVKSAVALVYQGNGYEQN